MNFKKVIDYSGQPLPIYDGGEIVKVKIPFIESNVGTRDVLINLDAPEMREWRHYYSDCELNQLKDELRFGFKFLLHREVAYHRAIDHLIYLQPVYKYKAEYTICFSYDEVNPSHYVFWLISIWRREIERGEFDSRVENIKRDWLSHGG